MAVNRFREAMADMAETIRRVFQAPATLGVPLGFRLAVPGAAETLTTSALEPSYRFQAETAREPALEAGLPLAVATGWTAVLREDPGWTAWAAGAVVCQLPLFQAEKCQRLAVPALPARAAGRRVALDAFASRTRSGWTGFGPPAVRREDPGLPAPACRRDLEQALSLPVAFTGEDIQKLSKALWMRYTLQLVRGTGQNIRNLEVLGLYWIPSKGTRQVRQDPATGRLLVNLGPEAVGARKAPFILARQKDDASVVCCFVEEL